MGGLLDQRDQIRHPDIYTRLRHQGRDLPAVVRRVVREVLHELPERGLVGLTMGLFIRSNG